MQSRPLHVGIDLGTTNSTAAIFDGEAVSLVRNRQGAALTPSVVRIDARGNVSVGERARRALDSDPQNTRAEFKRLMGTDQRFEFPAAKLSRKPEELAAEVLRVLRGDVLDQAGVSPERAVVSVPALFELPQIAATSEAARLAGFERIEVIQEPVASAIAAGWSVDDPGANWLVYDLGGGTFDVSLLQTQEGLLRVVGHDGDNFLGGRDIDAAIVGFVLAELKAQGVEIDRADPAHAVAFRRLRYAAEEAKIELARAAEAAISLPGLFRVGGQDIDVDTWLDRAALTALVTPLVDRSLVVCQRLLKAHGISAADLDRIVLVGGPTAMPLLRERVATVLGAPFGEGLDPMTLVAQGAALYAATAGVDGRPAQKAPDPVGPRAWLQYPAVSSDPAPYVVGRVLEPGDVVAVQVERVDGNWTSGVEALDPEGAFALPVQLVTRQASDFRVVGLTSSAQRRPLHPPSFRILHGVTIADPPLSRSIGVALADDTVHVYVERGAPLPMRRTFTHKTVESVRPGSHGAVLKVPVVQGEFGLAHLCRLVGTISIPGADISAPLPAGSEVEITLELDRGGRLSARAMVPALKQSFDQVAHLVVPALSVEAMEEALGGIEERARDAQADAFRRGDTAAIESLTGILNGVEQAARDIDAAKGGDADAGEKARRALLDADAAVADAEAARAWPDAVERAQSAIATAAGWVGRYGDEVERKVFRERVARIEQLINTRQAGPLERELRGLEQLWLACYYRAPGSWEFQFHYAAARVSEAMDLPRAEAAVREGKAALAKGDSRAVEKALRALWALLPPEAEERRLGHDSGVR